MNPIDVQTSAQNELQPGESLVWSGAADPQRAALSAIPAAFFGIPFAGFALFWIWTASTATHAHPRNVGPFAFFPLFGVPFLLIGLGIVLSPLWAYLRGQNTVYVVTNRRVMLISGGRNRDVKSYTPTDIVGVEHKERPDGSGDVLIRTQGQIRQNNAISQITVGFYGVPDVRSVARMVLDLHIQHPAV